MYQRRVYGGFAIVVAQPNMRVVEATFSGLEVVGPGDHHLRRAGDDWRGWSDDSTPGHAGYVAQFKGVRLGAIYVADNELVIENAGGPIYRLTAARLAYEFEHTTVQRDGRRHVTFSDGPRSATTLLSVAVERPYLIDLAAPPVGIAVATVYSWTRAP
jgi:hypothetical protein